MSARSVKEYSIQEVREICSKMEVGKVCEYFKMPVGFDFSKSTVIDEANSIRKIQNINGEVRSLFDKAKNELIVSCFE